MALFLLFLIMGALYTLYKINKNDFIINDLVWLFTPWLVTALFYSFGGISYESTLDVWSSSYLVLCAAIFFVFRKFALKLAVRNSFKNNDNKKINTLPLFVFSIFSGLALLIYVLTTNTIEWGYTRKLNSNMINTLLYFFSCSSIVIWLYELAFSLKFGIRIRKHLYLCLLVYIIQPLLVSGRDGLLYLILLTIIILFRFKTENNIAIMTKAKRDKNFKRLKIIGYFSSVIILSYMIFLSHYRYGDYMVSLFEWSANCKISDDLLGFIDSVGLFGPLILNFMYYYSSQLSKFAFVFNYYDGPYLGGFLQLSIISRRLPESWNLNYTEVVDAARDLMEGRGFYGLHSMWDTGIGYFIYDFGRIGALVEVAFIGFIAGLVVKRYRKNPTITNLIYLDFLCVGLFVTSMYSPVFSTAWLFPLIWVYIFDKFYKRLRMG